MDEMKALINKDNIDLHYIEVKSNIRTCTTVINKENESTTELVEEPNAVDVDSDIKIRELFSNIIEKCST